MKHLGYLFGAGLFIDTKDKKTIKNAERYLARKSTSFGPGYELELERRRHVHDNDLFPVVICLALAASLIGLSVYLIYLLIKP